MAVAVLTGVAVMPVALSYADVRPMLNTIAARLKGLATHDLLWFPPEMRGSRISKLPR
jgi:hypothetical protein